MAFMQLANNFSNDFILPVVQNKFCHFPDTREKHWIFPFLRYSRNRPRFHRLYSNIILFLLDLFLVKPGNVTVELLVSDLQTPDIGSQL